MRIVGWLPRLALVILAGALLITATVVAIAPRLWHVANAHDEDPVELPEFEPLAQRSYVYDAYGNELAIYELENSQPIDYEDIPTHVIEAFLVVEDNEFFTHHGVNVRSLIRATLSNFASDAPQQGASTITMQVVKNDFLAGLERDGRYKLLQTHYALMLEKELTKEEILERYLNTVFFGNNSYGIQAAAETYFGKTAQDLTFIEAAFLAGLVRSPSGFDPINEPERSRARWFQVIDRLLADEYITQEQALELEEFTLPERVKTLPGRNLERTYFTEALRDYLLNRSTILGETYQERYNRLFRGGLRIHTTLDPNLQAQAEAARTVLPANSQGIDSALVSLDSNSGAVRVMVGGPGFQPGEREVNMALQPRQTGSSIKYMILAAAMQAGAQAGDTIDGVRGCVLPNPEDPTEPFIISGGVAGSVTTLEQQTWSSVNCAFARLSQIVGLHRLVDTVYRMASSSYLYRDQPTAERTPIFPYASFATGANELSPMDMAAGVQTLANEGLHHEPYYVDYIDDADGNRLYSHLDPGTEVFTRDAALSTIDILKGVIYNGGTGRRAAFEDGRPAFGKTGTQQDNTNAWFVGATEQLSTAVWVGDPDAYTPMTSSVVPEFGADGVPRVQGGLYPARIWNAFMEPAHVGLPFNDWDAPPEPPRPDARLVLPGVECAYEIVGYQPGAVIAPPASAGGGDAEAPAEAPAEGGDAAAEPQGFRAQPTEEPPPAGTEPPPEEGTEVQAPAPVQTSPPVPIYAPVDVGTTIPPDIVDPTHPLPTIPAGVQVGRC